MADYSTIKGFTIQTLASDPYTSAVSSGTWASGNVMNQARANLGGCGTQTAGLGFGGYKPGSATNETEKYDGTTWTEVGDLNTPRYKL